MQHLPTINECHFCTDLIAEQIPDDGKSFYLKYDSNKKAKLIKTMNHSLYVKYSSSQNYHYTKDLNDILGSNRTTATVLHKDFGCYDDDSEECLNRIYNSLENHEKFIMLGEYYKFHKDIPRLYMLPAIISLNWFHDHKRRLEYFRIARMIEQENQDNPDKPPKGIVGDSPALVRESENFTSDEESSDLQDVNYQHNEQKNLKKDKILDEISWLKVSVKDTAAPRQSQKLNQQIKLQQFKYIKLQDQQLITKNTQISQQTDKIKQPIENSNSNQKSKQNINQFQQVQLMQKALSNSQQQKPQSVTQKDEPIKDLKSAQWKKNLKLDEVILKQQQQEDVTIIRQCQTTTNNNSNSRVPIAQQKRPSISSIMQIIKNIPNNGTSSKSNKISMDASNRPEVIVTPRQIQVSIAHPKPQSSKNKEKLRISALLSTHKLVNLTSKSPYSQVSIDLHMKSQAQLLGKSQYSQFIGNVTPRNGFLAQSQIISPKTSPKQGQSQQFKQKVQMLELKVLTDLQQLQTKKQAPKSKKHQTLQLDSLSIRSQDPISLTQRFVTSEPMDYTTMKMKQIYQRKKCNLFDFISNRQIKLKSDIQKQYPSGAQSHRDNQIRQEQFTSCKNKSGVRIPGLQINTSAEQFKSSQIYYNNVPVSAQSNPSLISTFATQSQSSCQNSINNKNVQDFKVLGGTAHNKSSSYNNKVNKQVKIPSHLTLQELDSQLYKAALNLAIKIKDPGAYPKLKEMIIQSARGSLPNGLIKPNVKQTPPLTYRLTTDVEHQLKNIRFAQNNLKSLRNDKTTKNL